MYTQCVYIRIDICVVISVGGWPNARSSRGSEQPPGQRRGPGGGATGDAPTPTEITVQTLGEVHTVHGIFEHVHEESA